MNHQIARVVVRIGLLLGAAAMLFPAQILAQTPTATAHASGIDLGALMTNALGKMHSFKSVSDSITTHAPSSPGGVMKMHVEEIFVRHDTGFAMSMQMTIDGKYSAEVFTGTHVCLKRSAAAAWNCSTPPSMAQSSMANLDPAKAFKASGIVMTSAVSLGTKNIQGQPCAGYKYDMSVPAIHMTGHGTIWFSSADGRPVQVDGVSTTALVAGSPPMVTTSTGNYSRWNDASLRIPQVPAS
jgi:hypothetical protein